jgi:hypothetical protein
MSEALSAAVPDAKEKRATILALKDCGTLSLEFRCSYIRSQITRLKRRNTQREVEFFVEFIELAEAALQES